MRVVIDTNVFVSALISADGAPRKVIRFALEGQIEPVFGNALFAEYEDVLAREALFTRAPLNRAERSALFDALLSVSRWTSVHFLWRPNLIDEADNHVVELAIAAGADAIITGNIRDFRRADLLFPALQIYTAGDFIQSRRRI